MKGAVVVDCGHDPVLNCGCWTDGDGVIQRHAFRFLAGDLVRHVTWKGFTGTVRAGGQHLYVVWDEIPGLGSSTPSAFPANFEIMHIEGG